jgi:pyrimidine operon attenuation protein/uracil phosphoribosyltransferase
MSTLTLDAPSLVQALVDEVARLLRAQPDTALVGVWSGGAWLATHIAETLSARQGRAVDVGTISSTLHRDDYNTRGLSPSAGQTRLPFEVEGRHILLVDDVLYTGRTLRAVINELFDFGRPASVSLVVLVDRGGRELPIEARFSAARMALPPNQRLSLARSEAGVFSFDIA